MAKLRYIEFQLKRTARGWECWILDCHGRESWTAHRTRAQAISWGTGLGAQLWEPS